MSYNVTYREIEPKRTNIHPLWVATTSDLKDGVYMVIHRQSPPHFELLSIKTRHIIVQQNDIDGLLEHMERIGLKRFYGEIAIRQMR